MSERRTDRLLEVPEQRTRAFSDFEVRQNGDGYTLTGYASVFESPYEVYGGPTKGGWTEVVDRKAFDVTLREKPDVHLLVNHEGMSFARTKSGTLTLATDKVGLGVTADLDGSVERVRELASAMRRGDVDEMSFAFRTIQHLWSEDDTERRLLEVSIHKGDVSVVNNGANPATSSQLRSALASLADLDFDRALAEVRSFESLDRLEAARDNVSRLLREATPEERRTLTVAEALKVIEA